ARVLAGLDEIMACLPPARAFAPLTLVLLAFAAAGCQTLQPTATADTTGSIGSWPPGLAAGDGEPRGEVDTAGALYRAHPDGREAAIRYAAALRAIGERAQASAVLEQASIKHPNDRGLLGAYGKALADAGNFAQAFEVLGRAHTPDQPDWRLLSVQGAVLDQMGRHEEAGRYYASDAQARSGGSRRALESRPVVRALEKPQGSRGRASPCRGAAGSATARAPEPGARRRTAGPLPGGGRHRPCRPAARGSRRQRRLSAR